MKTSSISLVSYGRTSAALAQTLPVLGCIAAIVAFQPRPAMSAEAAASRSYADLSIEELLNVPVTSVSKKTTKFGEAPTAISIVSADDIRRMGFTSIPEALRLVPGMDVARVNAGIWAISSRGFNGPYANKLLVLVDGRSVYTPLFGGVYWDTQDMVLEDIDRIEAIRGPGATLWGANAVNGVVNIISKPAKETQGTLISSSFGTEDQPSASFRYGGATSPRFHYRVYLKYFDREGLVDDRGRDTPDEWRAVRTGFRTDWEPRTEQVLTVQGDYYSARLGENVIVPRLAPPFAESADTENDNRGGNVLARWTRTYSEASHLSLQAYFDGFRHEGGKTIERRDTFDVQLEGRFAAASRQDIVWGAGYRFSTDKVNNTPLVEWRPTSRDLNLFTAFVQDEITIAPERWFVTLGSKIEHNDFTGIEVQPSIRLRWHPSREQTFWAALSRAVSTPSRFYRNARLTTGAFPSSPGGLAIVPTLISNPDSKSETERAFEFGYRIESAANLSFDFSAFYNEYDRVNTSMAGDPVFELEPAPPHLLLPLIYQNAVAGETHGGEISVQWKPVNRWRITASYTRLEMRLAPEDFALKANPRHQASLRSYLTLPNNTELNTAVFYVDRIAAQVGTTNVTIPAYARFDAGFLWRPKPAFEIGVWGQNLLDPQHPETTAINTTLRTEVPRTFLGRLTWRF